jgi:hypothetical protein
LPDRVRGPNRPKNERTKKENRDPVDDPNFHSKKFFRVVKFFRLSARSPRV